MKLTNKQKSKIRREVDLELNNLPYKQKIHKNKKKYDRKKQKNPINNSVIKFKNKDFQFCLS